MNKKDLVNYLNEYLDINSIKDASKNGLQVDNTNKEIKKIGYAVDATSYIFEKAEKLGVDFLITHHGIFWGVEETITGISYERISSLIKNNIALYASHLPLDADKKLGNNAIILDGLISLLGLDENDYTIEPFGNHNTKFISFGIKFKKELSIEDFKNKYIAKNNFLKDFYNFGDKKTIKSIAICSGSGRGLVDEVYEKEYELYITGELNHTALTKSKEMGLAILLGGHRETETLGVEALSKNIKDKFGIDYIFIDSKY